jgi:hypothetical protein
MTKILFSLPVHENPEIVRDQIENINFFCPGATICIHVSAGASSDKDEFNRHCDFENVIINPSSYETIWCEGLMHVHASNFLYAIERNINFDKIMLISSNELFVKPGVADYVSRYRIGAQTEIYDSATDWGSFRQDLLSSRNMRKFISKLGLPLYFGGQAEGQFYDRRIFAHITRLYIDDFPMGPCGFPSEEIIPTTVAAAYCMMGVNAALPITLCDYCTNITMSEDVVSLVRDGRGAIFARRSHGALRSPHIGSAVLKGVFSIKRVPRKDCDLRRYIRNLAVAA